MFENVDGRTTDGRRTDDGVTGILIAHLGAFGSGELNMKKGYDVYTLFYRDLLKQSRPRKGNPVAELKAYPCDRRRCVILALKENLK